MAQDPATIGFVPWLGNPVHHNGNNCRFYLTSLYWVRSRRIEGGGDRISTVSFRKNRFYALLKCVSSIFY